VEIVKLAVPRKELMDALGVFKAVCSRPVIPILKMVRLAARKDALEIQGTDLDTFLTFTCPARVSEAGEALVELRPFEKMVKAAAKASDTILRSS
jgi:DNA polymerase III sliding clamp (beta) subunit (PCNA family)